MKIEVATALAPRPAAIWQWSRSARIRATELSRCHLMWRARRTAVCWGCDQRCDRTGLGAPNGSGRAGLPEASSRLARSPGRQIPSKYKNCPNLPKHRPQGVCRGFHEASFRANQGASLAKNPTSLKCDTLFRSEVRTIVASAAGSPSKTAIVCMIET